MGERTESRRCVVLWVACLFALRSGKERPMWASGIQPRVPMRGSGHVVDRAHAGQWLCGGQCPGGAVVMQLRSAHAGQRLGG